MPGGLLWSPSQPRSAGRILARSARARAGDALRWFLGDDPLLVPAAARRHHPLMRVQERYQVVCDRAAETGRQVVTGRGGVAVAAGNDVVVAAGVDRAGGRGVLRRAGQVAGRQRRGPALIGQGDKRGPLRGAGAGPAEHLPAALAEIGSRIVDRKAGVGIGVVTNVGRSPPAVADDAVTDLVAGLRFVAAGPAAAAAPGGLGAGAVAAAVQGQRGTANR